MHLSTLFPGKYLDSRSYSHKHMETQGATSSSQTGTQPRKHLHSLLSPVSWSCERGLVRVSPVPSQLLRNPGRQRSRPVRLSVRNHCAAAKYLLPGASVERVREEGVVKAEEQFELRNWHQVAVYSAVLGGKFGWVSQNLFYIEYSSASFLMIFVHFWNCDTADHFGLILVDFFIVTS